jgi:hypothetical protein
MTVTLRDRGRGTMAKTWVASELVVFANLASGQCCNLKYETKTHRVWLCRVGGGVTVETLTDGRWRVSSGSCTSNIAEVS